jgi:hypothetical protein
MHAPSHMQNMSTRLSSPHRSHRPCVLVVCDQIAMEGRHSSIFSCVNSVNPLARTHDTRFPLRGSKLPSGRSCGDHNNLHPATFLPRVGTAECMHSPQHSPIHIWQPQQLRDHHVLQLRSGRDAGRMWLPPSRILQI